MQKIKWKMKKIFSILAVLVFSGALLSGPFAYAEGRIDDAGVLAHLEQNTNINSYLNYYHYRLWKADHRYSAHDMYINSDDSVIVDTWNGELSNIYILKPGYTTDKGIQIGMTRSDLENAYGKIFIDDDKAYYAYTGACGYGWRGDSSEDGSYEGYIFVDYISPLNEGLDFVINSYTNQIVLIRYKKDRHGSTWLSQEVKEYNLLPYLD